MTTYNEARDELLAVIGQYGDDRDEKPYHLGTDFGDVIDALDKYDAAIKESVIPHQDDLAQVLIDARDKYPRNPQDIDSEELADIVLTFLKEQNV